MWITSKAAGTVRHHTLFLNWRRFIVRLVLVTATLHSSGCALLHTASSAVTASAGNAASPQTIDTKTQAEACRRTAIQLAAHEKDDHAIAQLERARELNPRIKGTAHLLAVLYDRQGRMDAADREYQQALKESRHDADVLNDYGYFLYTRDDLARAEELLQLALCQKHDHPKAQVNLGLVRASQGRMEESFATFEKAVGPAAAHHNIGMLLIRKGQRVEGLEHLEQAAQKDPSLQSEKILARLEDLEPKDSYAFADEGSASILTPRTE